MSRPAQVHSTAHLKPWDRRPDEGPKPYAAFVIYRDLGPGRSIDAAYRHARGQLPPRGRANGAWFEWSAKFKWPERVAAWDEHLRAISDSVREEAQVDAAARLEDARKKHVNKEAEIAAILGDQLLKFLRQEFIRREKVKQPGGEEIEQEIMTGEAPAYSNFAQLARAFSYIGRTGLGMANQDEDEPDPTRFREVMFKTRGQLEKRLPPGALPEMPADPSAKPNLKLSAEQLAEAGLGAPGANGNAPKPPKVRPENG